MSRKGAETQRDAHWFTLTRWVNACLLLSVSSLRLCAFAPLRDIPSPDLGLTFNVKRRQNCVRSRMSEDFVIRGVRHCSGTGAPYSS